MTNLTALSFKPKNFFTWMPKNSYHLFYHIHLYLFPFGSNMHFSLSPTLLLESDWCLLWDGEHKALTKLMQRGIISQMWNKAMSETPHNFLDINAKIGSSLGVQCIDCMFLFPLALSSIVGLLSLPHHSTLLFFFNFFIVIFMNTTPLF